LITVSGTKNVIRIYTFKTAPIVTGRRLSPLARDRAMPAKKGVRGSYADDMWRRTNAALMHARRQDIDGASILGPIRGKLRSRTIVSSRDHEQEIVATIATA
jgi:hypothetical protein